MPRAPPQSILADGLEGHHLERPPLPRPGEESRSLEQAPITELEQLVGRPMVELDWWYEPAVANTEPSNTYQYTLPGHPLQERAFSCEDGFARICTTIAKIRHVSQHNGTDLI